MRIFNRNNNFVIAITILPLFQKLEFLGSYKAGGHELRQGLPILSSIEVKCTDPLIRSIQPDEQGSNLKYGGIGAPLNTGTGLNPAHLGVGMGKGIKGDHGVGFHRGNKDPASGIARIDGVTPGVPPSAAGYENLGRPVRHGG